MVDRRSHLIFKNIVAFAVVVSLVWSASLLAHHGEAAHYDASKELVVEAVLTDFHLVNPHAYVYFDVQGEDGVAQQWRCELGTNLRRFGWTEETLAPGGRVRVTGNPARREEHVCKILSIEHEDGRTIGFRGTPTEGTSTYKPSAEQLAFVPESKPEIDVLARSTGEAVARKIVDVPTEGFFGYWSGGPGVQGIAGGGGRRGQQDTETVASDFPAPTSYPTPSYTVAGKAVFDSYDASFDNPTLYCTSSVFDGMVHHGISNEFVQESDDKIRWVYGYMDLVRTIHMDQQGHPEDIALSTLGHSIGKWEGDTLVIDTLGLKKQWLYNTGRDGNVISSDNLHLVERMTHDPVADEMVIEYTATDPEYWEEPISGVLRLSRSDTAYQEYGCVELAGDNNRRPDGTTIFD